MEYPHGHEALNFATHGEVTAYIGALVEQVKIGLLGKSKDEIQTRKKELLSMIKVVMQGMDTDEEEQGIGSLPADTVNQETAENYQKLRDYMTAHFPELDQYISFANHKKVN